MLEGTWDGHPYGEDLSGQMRTTSKDGYGTVVTSLSAFRRRTLSALWSRRLKNSSTFIPSTSRWKEWEQGREEEEEEEEIRDDERSTKIHQLSSCLEGCALMSFVRCWYHLSHQSFSHMVERRLFDNRIKRDSQSARTYMREKKDIPSFRHVRESESLSKNVAIFIARISLR